MPAESHIVRFKVASVESASMPNGQQYTIFYRRGETKRSTPCYVAQNGTVDFSSMPEGAAVVHFQRGHMGRRYAPKFIQMRVEEYTRGAPRRTVGETEVDCSEVIGGGSSGSGIVTVMFRMYGLAAKMKVAILVYPEHAPPLSFEGLVAASGPEKGSRDSDQAVPQGEIKVMGRGEAMTLLISLETMLERRKSEAAAGKSTAQSPLEKRFAELEEKRKNLTGSEGLATTVVNSRCQLVVEAQFVALARKYRNNYIGETAAYLRQLALSSGVSLTGSDDATEMDSDTLVGQLDRATGRIEELRLQVRKLEEEQAALGRIQHKTDVTAELCANLDKVASVEAQIKMLEQSRDALNAALRDRSTTNNTPLSRDVKEINERVKTLNGEQEQLRAKIRHMTAVAAAHVLSWARSKNPPAPEPTQTKQVDDLLSSSADSANAVLREVQRKQILSAFQGIGGSAPPATARSVSSSGSSSGHHTPRDLFSDAPGLPSMGDFGGKKKAPEKKPEAAKKPDPPVHKDPTAPGDLGVNMFSAEQPKPQNQEPTGLPSMNDFMVSANKPRNAPSSVPSFDFGAPAQATTSPDTDFFAEPQRPQNASASPGAGQGGARRPQDDPFYDEMDDFTVGVNQDEDKVATVEFTDGFNPFGAFGSGSPDDSSPPATAPAAAISSVPPPRPTFNFGPVDDAASSPALDLGGDSSPALDFGGGGTNPGYDFGGDNTNRNTSAGYSNLPTYNFGS